MTEEAVLSRSSRIWRDRTLIVARADGSGSVKALGSCVALGGPFVVTCAHMVSSDADYVVVTNQSVFADWAHTGEIAAIRGAWNARVLYKSPEHDLALLELKGLNHQCNLPIDDRIHVGTSVGFYGYPFIEKGRLNLSATHGIVSSLVTVDNLGIGVRTIQVDGMSSEGNSG